MVTDLMPITGTTDNDIVLIIGIIVKDQFQRHDNHRYAKIIIEGRIIEGILKPYSNDHRYAGNHKSKENMQTKETMAKSSWKTLIPTMKQVKRERNNCAFLEIYRFL
jgi:hypothetical protein